MGLGSVLPGACTPTDEAEVGVARQAIGLPTFLGPVGARLGASLAPCPGGDFLAGGPGIGVAVFTRDGGSSPAQSGSLGLAVACSGASATPARFAAGTLGVRQVQGATWQPFTSQSAVALAASPQAGLPLLVGEAAGSVRFLALPGPGGDVRSALSGGPGFGGALAWFPGSTRFVVSDPGNARVVLFELLVDGGVPMVGSINNMAQGFGRSVVVGDVAPAAGPEVIIGSQGKVWVYQPDGVLISRLDGTTLSFGVALGVEPQVAAGLDALLVGEPALATVHRFVGDAGAVFETDVVGTGFGSSLAVDAYRQLAIGAPEYPTSLTSLGAVYVVQLASPGVLDVAMPCAAGLGCRTSSCADGTCLGGVLCVAPMPACLANERCESATRQCVPADAGVFADAGPAFDGGAVLDGGAELDGGGGNVDGGNSVDSGMPGADAGPPTADGGGVDAGPVRDAGSLDAGSEGDAGTQQPDGGAPDGGPADAGGPTTNLDAGVSRQPLVFTASGCASAPVGSLFGALLLVALRRRTR